MSSSTISPKVLRLLEKISQLNADEISEVEDFIEFLLTKKTSSSSYSGMSSENVNDSDAISDFIASFTSSKPDLPAPSSDSSFEFQRSASPFSETRDEIQKNGKKKISDIVSAEDNHVIVAPEEPVSEKYQSVIDFADINARFAKKREEGKVEKKQRESRTEDLDWL